MISYLGVVVGYINLLYLYPKFLDPTQVGLLRVIQDAAMLMVPFATIGLAQGIVRFYPQFSQTPAQIRAFVSLIVTLGLLGFIAFFSIFSVFESYILSFFKDNAAAVIRYKNLILALTFILLFTTIFEQFSKSILQVAFPNFLREIGIRVLQGVMVCLFFYAVVSFDQFILSSVLIYLFTLIILIGFLIRYGIRIHFKRTGIVSLNKIIEILRFSSLSFVSVSAMILIGKMDSIMVTGYLGLESVAIYTTAYYMATVIEIPKRAITQATTTLIARAFEKNNIVEVGELYRKTAVNQLIIGSLLLIGLWANLSNIFMLMPKGQVYEAGAQVVILVGIGKLIDMAFGPSSEVIGMSRFYWFNLICVSALAVIVIITNYLFIPRFGIVGAAFGSAFALVIYNGVKCIFIYVKLRIQPFTWAYAKVIAIAMGVAILNLLLPKVANVFLDIGYRSTLISVVFGFFIVGLRCSEEINRTLHTLWLRVRKRLGVQ